MPKVEKDEPSPQPEIRNMTINCSPRLEDIVGAARVFADEFLTNIRGGKVFQSMGVMPDKTYLLTGGPGLGKSMVVKALNNEMNVEIYRDTQTGKVPNLKKSEGLFFEYSFGQYGSKYINENSTRLQGFFNYCHTLANALPVILVLDECDAIMANRDGQQHSEDKKVLETLMTNLQTLHDSDNLYAIMMTNLPNACDEASLRAGRIDRKIEFKTPILKERELAFRTFADRINQKAGYQVLRGLNYLELAKYSEGCNYADIDSILQATVKNRAREIIEDRTNKIIPAGYVTHKRVVEHTKQHSNKYHPKKTIGFA